MEKTLPELVEILKSRGLEYAVFNWTAEYRTTQWFDPCVYFVLGNKLVSSKEVAPVYQDAIADVDLSGMPATIAMSNLQYPVFDTSGLSFNLVSS